MDGFFGFGCMRTAQNAVRFSGWFFSVLVSSLCESSLFLRGCSEMSFV